MVALLQVRNFPDQMYRAISELARAERRSIGRQAALLIEKGLAASGISAEKRRIALERAMRRELPATVKEADLTRMIREDRDQ
ncbi:MAG: hypothetical protein LBU39_05015 [Desulfobulbaceae bacterium]|nr:hypothetical protein [Desulfobulbaceae bacterium]